MRSFHKSILSWLLILAMLLCTIPVSATEMQYLEPVMLTCVNPLYADVITEEDLLPVYPVMPVFDETEYLSDLNKAVSIIQENLLARNEYFSVNIQFSKDTNTTSMMRKLMDLALEHNGNPVAGDYLRWQYGGWNCSASGYQTSDTYYLTFSYATSYYTDFDQEEEVTEAVDDVLEDIIDEDMTDREKFQAIYDWMCTNITYDDTSSGPLKHSAYAAMINKTAVCQGYANLLYRMLLEVGIDNRMISGIGNGGGHAWNIVELDGLYYNVDATWDAGANRYGFCLQSDADFEDHYRDSEYATDAFYKQYPMADYDPDKIAEAPKGYRVLTRDTNANWFLTEDVYVDLAGYDMTGTVQLNGYQIYGMDSTTDKYTCDEMGTFNCVDASGAEIVPARHWKGTEEQIGSIKRYMTIDTEDGYTFHRFYLGITHISMKPSAEDVGFKAVVAGDEMVFAQLDQEHALGHSMHLGDENTITLYHGKDELRSGRPHRLGIDHFDIDHKSEVTLYAKVMLTLTDGTVISTDEVSMTVRSMLEQLNDKYASLIASQLQSIREMLARHPIVKQWGLDKLLGLS